MKIILKSDVYNLGRAGQVINVKPGYARNYLFPNNLALPNKASSAKEWKHKSRLAEIKSSKGWFLRDAVSKKIEGKTFVFEKEVSEKGTLFGSVTAFEIISHLKEQGFNIDKKTLKLEAAIKETGEHKVELDFGKDSKALITISVKGKKMVAKKEQAVLKEEVSEEEIQEEE